MSARENLLSEQDMKDIEKFVDDTVGLSRACIIHIDNRKYASAAICLSRIEGDAIALKKKLNIGYGHNNESPDTSDFK